jgi:guanylate kinase
MGAKRFIIVSGPSCVGKGPLIAAVREFYPEVGFEQVPVIKSRESRVKGVRPDEEAIWGNPDYFRAASEIEGLRGDERYVVGDSRGFAQAFDLEKVRASGRGVVLAEIYHTIAMDAACSEALRDIEVVTVFVSPVSEEELERVEDAGAWVTEVMMEKQVARGRWHGKEIDEEFLADARKRAEDAIDEIGSAERYDHVIVNHDGEGHENWRRDVEGRFYGRPAGDAGKAVEALVKIMNE